MAITPTQVTNAGVTDTLVAATASESFTYPATAGVVWMEVATSGTASIITIESEANVSDGIAEADKAVSLDATERKKFRISEAFVASDDTVGVTASATTGVTWQVFYI